MMLAWPAAGPYNAAIPAPAPTIAAMLRPNHAAVTALLTALVALGPMSTDLYLPSLPALTAHFGVGAHRAQLVHHELAPALPHASLPVEDRPRRRQTDGERREDANGRGEDEKAAVRAKIKGFACGAGNPRSLSLDKAGIVRFHGNLDEVNLHEWIRGWLEKAL